jgi:hypothetical protein
MHSGMMLLAVTILGMSVSAYTRMHVAISLVAIASGLLVVFGMFAAKRLNAMTALFLVTTVLTSVTGFFFPFKGVTPGIVVGIISLLVLLIAILARYSFHMAGRWRTTYVVTAVISLYFNVFVLIAQLFEHVPSLHVLAPTGSEGPFKIAQLVNLVLFIALGVVAVKKFRVLEPALTV